MAASNFGDARPKHRIKIMVYWFCSESEAHEYIKFPFAQIWAQNASGKFLPLLLCLPVCTRPGNFSACCLLLSLWSKHVDLRVILQDTLRKDRGKCPKAVKRKSLSKERLLNNYGTWGSHKFDSNRDPTECSSMRFWWISLPFSSAATNWP